MMPLKINNPYFRCKIKAFLTMNRIIILCIVLMLMNACSIFHRTPKNGCPTNGKNVDAGRLAAGDPKAIKDAQKAPKFKLNKY